MSRTRSVTPKLEHIPHQHQKSLSLAWLLNALALTLERLYHLRY
ncbi:MAG TPA: hypothetical protein VEK33_17835 [Terriglobales bacterium]|nr:hypothetical protein [Terriglobales bacterium]